MRYSCQTSLTRSPARVWRRVDQLLDAVAAKVGGLVRPTPLPVSWNGGTAWLVSRGTCCQYYTAHHQTPNPRAKGYCWSCPLRTEGGRARRIEAYLDALAE